MSWQIVPVLNAARGPRPSGVPAKPVVPYIVWPPLTRQAADRNVTALNPHFLSARHVRRYLDEQRGHRA